MFPHPAFKTKTMIDGKKPTFVDINNGAPIGKPCTVQVNTIDGSSYHFAYAFNSISINMYIQKDSRPVAYWRVKEFKQKQ